MDLRSKFIDRSKTTSFTFGDSVSNRETPFERVRKQVLARGMTQLLFSKLTSKKHVEYKFSVQLFELYFQQDIPQ